MDTFNKIYPYGNGLKPEPGPEPILGPGYSPYPTKPVILGPNPISIHQQQNIR